MSQITPAASSGDNIFSLAMYEGPVKNAIHSLKYRRNKWIAISFAEWMNDFLNQHQEIKFDLIIPVTVTSFERISTVFQSKLDDSVTF